MINATVGHANANSYVDVAYADEFFQNSINNGSWPTVLLIKEAALIEATRIIDSQFDWNGDILVGDQSLRWPRKLAYDIDGRLIASDVVPKILKDAVCNFAYFLVQSGGLSQTASDLKSLKVGPIDLKFNDGLSVIGIPRFVAKSLQSLGNFQGVVQGSAYNTNVIRS